MHKLLTAICTLAGKLWLIAGTTRFSYYLPDQVTYNPAIPTPKSVIGHEVGEWHISHDRLVNYMYALAQASDRISIQETGRTFETRPLLADDYHVSKEPRPVEEIRQQHVQLN
jgi:hypothetical protein